MRTMMAVVCLAIMGAASCGGSHAESVCLEYVDRLAKVFERCQSGSYQTAHDSIMQGIGGCEKVKKIRDESALTSQCYPFLTTVSCSTLAQTSSFESIAPAACAQQLLY